MRKITYNKIRSGHALGTVLGITMLVLLLLAGNAGAAPFAYITNSGSNNVSVIDTATNTIIASVNVGETPEGVAVNPEGTRVYVANRHSNNVSVIDTATNTIAASVNVGSQPDGVAVNPAGTRVYVTNMYSNNVSVIDTATNTIAASVNVGAFPRGVAVNPEGTKVYVANQASNNVSVIDTATNTVTSVNVRGNPIGVVVNPMGTKVYVATAGSISVIDTATNTVTSVDVGVGGSISVGVAVNPAGTKVYVTNRDNVYVIDTATNAVTAVVPVGSNPEGPAVNPAGTRVYVANSLSNNVSVIDAATNTVIYSVNVGNGPVAFGLFIGPEAAPTNTIGYSAIVPSGQQNTFIQATNGSFGTIPKGQSGTIINSVVLNNTGDADATVDARFITGAGAIYGLVNGSNILGAGNFSLGRSNATSWTALLDSGVNTRVTNALSGAETALGARLYIPVNQPGGAYSGTVVLTFGNVV